MEISLFHIITWVAGGLVTAALSVFAHKVFALEEKHAAQQLHVAETYVSKADFKEALSEIKADIKEVLKELKEERR